MDPKDCDASPGEIHPAPGEEMVIISTMPDGATTKKTETRFRDGSMRLLEESLDSSGVKQSEKTTRTRADRSSFVITKKFDAEGIKQLIEEDIDPDGRKQKTEIIMPRTIGSLSPKQPSIGTRAAAAAEVQQQHILPHPPAPSMMRSSGPIDLDEENPSCEPTEQRQPPRSSSIKRTNEGHFADEHFVEFHSGSLGRFLRRPVCWVLSLLLVVLIGLAVGLGVGLSPKKNEAAPQSMTEEEQPQSMTEEEQQLHDLLSEVSTDNGAALSEPNSPQNKAFVWLSSKEEASTYTEERKIQLFGLSTLFFSMGGEDWDAGGSTGWLAEEDECKWSGIACNEEGAVTTLDLNSESIKLAGTLPAELGVMSQLQNLLVRGHPELKGTIPTEMGLATDLQFIWLENDGLTGTLPTELGNLGAIIILAVNGNFLTGSIPTELGNMPNANSFQFSWNDLTGEMPQEVCALRENGILAFLESDCGGDPNPEVVCSCCTGCNSDDE